MVKEGRADREIDRAMRESFAEVTWNRQTAHKDEWSRLGEVFVLQ